MLRTLIVAAVLAIGSSCLEAKLWETIAQTEARYGKSFAKFPAEQQRGEEQRKYRYKDFYVLVTFLNGRSDDEKYFHVNTKMAFSDRDIQLFLKMTSDGKDWQKSKELPIWTFGIASWKPKRPKCAREAELGNNRPI